MTSRASPHGPCMKLREAISSPPTLTFFGQMYDNQLNKARLKFDGQVSTGSACVVATSN